MKQRIVITVFIILTAVLGIWNLNLKDDVVQEQETNVVLQKTNDSLQKCVIVYDTVLSRILNDTNKITLSMKVLMNDPAIKSEIKKLQPAKKKPWYKRIFGKD